MTPTHPTRCRTHASPRPPGAWRRARTRRTIAAAALGLLAGLLLSWPALAVVTPDDRYFEMSADSGDYLDHVSGNSERLRSEPMCWYPQNAAQCEALYGAAAPGCENDGSLPTGCACECSPYIRSLDVVDPDHTASGRLQHTTCFDWEESSETPYMGEQSYRVECVENTDPLCDPDLGGDVTRAECVRRTEQSQFKRWYAGGDEGSRTRYFSLAFRLVELPDFGEDSSGYIAQMHQGGKDSPPFKLGWSIQGGKLYIEAAARGNFPDVWADPSASVCWEQMLLQEAELGVWYRVLIRFKVSPHVFDERDHRFPLPPGYPSYPDPDDPDDVYEVSPQCPVHLGAGDSELKIWLMDNETGTWEETGFERAECRDTEVRVRKEYQGPFGYLVESWKGCRNDGDCVLRKDIDCPFDWKMGIYANAHDGIVIDYDNVTYGKRWDDITHDRLVGYEKSVLYLPFSASTVTAAGVEDRSWYRNGGTRGDPTSDYANDAELIGPLRWDLSAPGGPYFRFDGSNELFVPNDPVDFDFGNYLTTSAWVRLDSSIDSDRGVVVVDDSVSAWKAKLVTHKRTVTFGVRHTNGSESQIAGSITSGSLADGRWHHLVGTYNRFGGRSGDRGKLTLYLDGLELASQETASSLPLLRPEQGITVGDWAGGGRFVGSIDDVDVSNYAWNAARVLSEFQTGSELHLLGCGDDGLVGYWPFQGDASDMSGCRTPGSVNGPVLAEDALGHVSGAYRFDGIDDHITLPSESTLKPPLPITLSFLVNHACAGRRCEIFENDASFGYSGFNVQLSPRGEVDVMLGDGGHPSPLNRRSATSRTRLASGRWHHVVAVVRGLTDADFYIDGVRDDRGSIAYSGTGAGLSYANLIGLMGMRGTAESHFEGALDELRLYRRALSLEESLELDPRCHPSDPLAPIGVWPLDGSAEANGRCAPIDGVVNGAIAVAGRHGEPNTAYDFDGVDDSIELGRSFHLKPSLPMTFEATVRHACTGSNSICRIFENDVAPNAYSGLSVSLSSGRIYAMVGDGGVPSSRNRRDATAHVALEPGVWAHIVIVVKALDEFEFYVDGERVDPASISYAGTGGAMHYTGAPAAIARSGTHDQPFRGDIDEVRLHDRALTAEEIRVVPEPGVVPGLIVGGLLLRGLSRRRRSVAEAGRG